MIRPVVHIILCLLLTLPVTAQVDLVTTSDSDRVYLRWKGFRQSTLTGYHVYRSPAAQNNWTQLTSSPHAPVWNRSEIEVLAGQKTYLYFGLFGLDETAGEIPPRLIDSIFQQPAPFFEVMTAINPEFGYVLGQVWVDSTAPPGVYDYRITVVEEGTEQEWVLGRNIRCCQVTTIPEPDFWEAQAGDGKVTLLWDKQADHLAAGRVVTYQIYRSTDMLGPFEPVNYTGLLPVTVTSGEAVTGADTMTHTDRLVQNGTTYYYSIAPVDAFGREGNPSPLLEVTPGPTLLPPAALRYRQVASQLEIRWSVAPHATGYQVFRSAGDDPFEPLGVAQYGLGQSATFHYEAIDPNVRELRFFVRSLGDDGRPSAPSDTLRIFLPDAYPPAAPTGLEALAERGEITLTWHRNTEPDVAGYRLYRTSDTSFAKGFLLQAELITETTYTDPIREDATTRFGYYLTAEDETGNQSAPSAMVKVQLPDYRPPQAPYITRIDRDGPRITLHWTSAQEPDLAYFTIQRSADNQAFADIGTTAALTYTDTLTTGGTFWYRLTATDSSDNQSTPSPSVSTAYDPNAQPLPPRAGALIDTNGSLLITWEPPPSSNVVGYLIVKKDLNTSRSYDAAEPEADDRSFLDRYAKMDHTIVYRIYARDARWRLSEPLILTYTPKDD